MDNQHAARPTSFFSFPRRYRRGMAAARTAYIILRSRSNQRASKSSGENDAALVKSWQCDLPCQLRQAYCPPTHAAIARWRWRARSRSRCHALNFAPRRLQLLFRRPLKFGNFCGCRFVLSCFGHSSPPPPRFAHRFSCTPPPFPSTLIFLLISSHCTAHFTLVSEYATPSLPSSLPLGTTLLRFFSA